MEKTIDTITEEIPSIGDTQGMYQKKIAEIFEKSPDFSFIEFPTLLHFKKYAEEINKHDHLLQRDEDTLMKHYQTYGGALIQDKDGKFVSGLLFTKLDPNDPNDHLFEITSGITVKTFGRKGLSTACGAKILLENNKALYGITGEEFAIKRRKTLGLHMFKQDEIPKEIMEKFLELGELSKKALIFGNELFKTLILNNNDQNYD